MNQKELSLQLHREKKGKIEVISKVPVKSMEDLSLAYSPGVGEVSRVIAENRSEVWNLTGRANAVAVVSDGTAVLGLGNIGPEAALPVMEGKAILFKEFAEVDAYPIVLNTQDVDEIVDTVIRISPGFGGINLEDISAPRCFEVERKLKEKLSIPVMHDDQHGTAIVVLAGMINALKLKNMSISKIRVVINGAGAAGIALAHLLDQENIGGITMCDTKGVLKHGREHMNAYKEEVVMLSSYQVIGTTLEDALLGADVFVGLSVKDAISKENVASMAKDPIIFALANPYPEIMPDEAKQAGAFVVATGRSDFPNQVNNVLAFPGIFRGALDNRVSKITDKMKRKAAHAIASLVENPHVDHILPNPFELDVAKTVAEHIVE